MQKILLITGWGGGAALLQPLQQHLQRYGHQVELINIFNGLDQTVLQHYSEQAQDFDVIMGWSLGGQLASLLVNQVEARFAQQKILITIASNPCFVAHAEWPHAMQPAVFQAFKQSFSNDAIATLKRFGYLVCQGSPTIKEDLISLQNLLQPQSLTLLTQGLACLEQLNLVEIIKNYSGRQYHLFAQQDALVSDKVYQNYSQFEAKSLATELLGGTHGLPLFKAQQVAEKICQYLQSFPEIK